jgi:hypothetical protein
MNCPECGAPDNNCETRYHECLVKEFTDADYGAVHHLTVAAYQTRRKAPSFSSGEIRRRWEAPKLLDYSARGCII